MLIRALGTQSEVIDTERFDRQQMFKTVKTVKLEQSR